MPPVEDHPQRYPMVAELHARPFPKISVPSHVVYLAVKEPLGAASRSRAADMEHLCDLLDRHGAPLPPEGATHHAGNIGRYRLSWESHTEFVSYLAQSDGVSQRPFDPAETAVFPEDWLRTAPGKRLVAVHIRIKEMPEDPGQLAKMVDDWFVPENLVCTWVVDEAIALAGDFRIDAAGQMRFALFVRPGTGPGRVGRVVQRLCDLEAYRAMSMLGLSRARELTARLNSLDPALSSLIASMRDADTTPEKVLNALLDISYELEMLAMHLSFRFGATRAYAALVRERVEMLRETRFAGRQKLGEFVSRRYDPAIRTVFAAEQRLNAMLERAGRAAELLRTRVDVDRSAQNQKLLESMDRRSDLQLRLQHTVEGLSVVAISYYAVSLCGYLAYPLAKKLGMGKEMMVAGLTPLVVLAVWLMLRRIKKGMGAH
ncbi:DUF3422 domain-containing protein [Thioclava sp. GXIMD4216]|uniref:DUF3422 domain-containing protein n=1 Tax=Thioclava litoralis TaxID=3076557 RepID=A0ABZ1E5I7_9RHOB|nr:DUF3422 domain-containing protein [Thioclava sp. FTW29]